MGEPANSNLAISHRQSQNMKILYDPRPRTTEEIFSEEDNASFFSDHEIFHDR